NDHPQNILAATLATGVAIDISLAVGLTAVLWPQYMRGTFMLKSYADYHYLSRRRRIAADDMRMMVLRLTKRMLQRQILFSVNTGMWTALAALIVFVIFMKSGSDDFTVYGYFHIMSPIYFFTVLTGINARSYLRKEDRDTSPTHISDPGTMRFAESLCSRTPKNDEISGDS
ncbi:LOW QUALITY PROTEIN: hypothetical protein CVT25_004063, partial [Psilocybe cyanescens]